MVSGQLGAGYCVKAQQNLNVVSSFFVRHAADWFEIIAHSTDSPSPTSWDELKVRMLEYWDDNTAPDKARERFIHVRQAGTLCDYVSQFQHELVMLGDMTDKDNILMFLKGLRPMLQGDLRAAKPNTLEQGLALANDFNSGRDMRQMRRQYGQFVSGGSALMVITKVSAAVVFPPVDQP